MLDKPKGTTNIGGSGPVVLYTPESSYFVRGRRKECRDVPKIFAKNIFS